MSLLRAFDGCATQFNILTVACGLSMAPGSVWWIWAGKEKVICQTLSLNCTVFWKLQVRAAWAAFLSLTSSKTELCHVIKLSAVLGRYLDFWWELLAHAWGALVGLYQHHCKTHTNELCCNYHMKTSLGWVNQQRMEIPDKHKWPTKMLIPVATMPLFPRRPAWFRGSSGSQTTDCSSVPWRSSMELCSTLSTSTWQTSRTRAGKSRGTTVFTGIINSCDTCWLKYKFSLHPCTSPTQRSALHESAVPTR